MPNDNNIINEVDIICCYDILGYDQNLPNYDILVYVSIHIKLSF